MLVPRPADGFRASVSAVPSLDGSKGVFHTLSLLEDRLLSKNLGRQMLEDVVLEELKTLGMHRGIPAAPLQTA
jgi:hypothetical protein